MQTRPDHPTLLDATARFLLAEVSPRLEADKALQFRVLIAANLAAVVAAELRTHQTRCDAELGRLRALFSAPAATAKTPDDELAALNHQLVLALRGGTVDRAQALAHCLATAKETLEVVNPRFDLS